MNEYTEQDYKLDNQQIVRWGVSRGETGEYGSGDIFKGTDATTDMNGRPTLDGEPCYVIFDLPVGVEPEYSELY